MTSYLDKVRTAPIGEPYTVVAWGFDPDMRHCGVANIEAVITPGHSIVYKNWNAYLIEASNKKLKGEAQVVNMCEAVTRHWAIDIPNPSEPTHKNLIMVESQEYYKGERVDANDLIHLAQVAGAILASVQRISAYPVELIRPKTWKGNKGKEGMHQRAIECLRSAGGEGFGLLEVRYGKNKQHAMDALCMALWLVGREAKRPVFG